MEEIDNQDMFVNANFYQQRNLPNATASLVLGIISIVGCGLYGIPGIVCGIIAISLHNKDKKIYATNPNLYAQSFKNSRAGFICGVVGLCLSILFIIFLVVYFIFVFSLISNLQH
jgi:hypothetical protein